ncbi:MAG: DUF4214 domain-containing protein [Cyanobacteria bacterium]|nr:DUF4214 domain-containing protein [Cyanobacteriota bacterium]
MKLFESVKNKKLGFSFFLLFFVLLIASLIFRNTYPGLYPVSIFFIILIFIFSQYLDFEYRYFISFALVLLITCPFLLIFKLNTLAEYFANYVYGFLVLGVVGYFFDNLREKLKNKGSFKVYKIIFLSILICVILGSAFFVYRDYGNQKDYIVLIKNNIIKISNTIKDEYNQAFNKEAYYGKNYSKNEEIVINGETLKENIIITVEEPKENSDVAGNAKITGWAIEGNSKENSGIDKIEFFMDGKPWEGKSLGSLNPVIIKSNPITENYITNLYLQFYNRRPEEREVNYWAANLEWGIYSYSDVAGEIAHGDEFKNRKLSNEEFVKILYKGLFTREGDSEGVKYWVNTLNGGLDRNAAINLFLNSDEFKKLSEGYYNKVSIHQEPLSSLRKDIGEKYGKQFALSGFDFEFDSLKFKNGKHTVYIYAHSPYFGWDFVKLDIKINN